jgi:4-methylaminobutanoate oxidase (formaldehyde-forming)
MFLQQVCANDVDRPIGSVVYSPLCNPTGGIEADLTVTRLDRHRYLLVTGTAFGAHDLSWLRTQQEQLPGGEHAVLTDVTSAHACLGLWGPEARTILAPLTRTDLSHEAFAYLSARRLNLGSVPVIASRVTYVGELGWELYVPTEYALALWDLLWEAGADRGLVAGGYRAIDALRVEKGYRVWGADVTPDDTPFHAGTGFAVALDKGDFVGRAALAKLKASGVDRRLRTLMLADGRAVAQGSEPVRVDGTITGRVTSGGYGFRLGRSIAFAYLPTATPPAATIEVEIFGQWIRAELAPRDAAFDPSGARIRA